MSEILMIVGFCFLAYLLCSIPFGKIIGRSKISNERMVDPQKEGSGNIGATNLFRVAGPLKAVITGALDVGKAALPVFLAIRILQLDIQNDLRSNLIILLIIIFAFLGSIFPVWLKFRGGKGVSVLLGSILVILGWQWLIVAASWICVIFIATMVKRRRLVSVGSLALPSILLPLFGFLWSIPFFYFLWLPATILIFWSHRENIQRLRKGTEGDPIKINFNNLILKAKQIIERIAWLKGTKIKMP